MLKKPKMIDFKGAHYPREVILYAAFFYVRYGVSYRDLEEIMAERGVSVDHATLNRWVVRYSPLIADEAIRRQLTWPVLVSIKHINHPESTVHAKTLLKDYLLSMWCRCSSKAQGLRQSHCSMRWITSLRVSLIIPTSEHYSAE